jgi:acyl carrier protein
VEIKKNLLLDDSLESEIKRSIQSAVFESHGISIKTWNIILLKSNTLPKTTSGKVRRNKCKEDFLSNSLCKANRRNSNWKFLSSLFFIWSFLEILYGAFGTVIWRLAGFDFNRKKYLTREERRLQEIRELLVSYMKNRLNISSIDTKLPFYEYGLKSQDAVYLCGQLEILLGRKLPPSLLYK